MSKLELTSLKCTSCGASIKGFEGKQEINCDYCGTLNKILRPKEVFGQYNKILILSGGKISLIFSHFILFFFL